MGWATVAGLAAIYGVYAQDEAQHKEQKQRDKMNADAKDAKAAAQQRATKAEVDARNQMEQSIEDESGGPRMVAGAAGPARKRMRRDTLTPRGLGIGRDKSTGSSGLNIGYQNV